MRIIKRLRRALKSFWCLYITQRTPVLIYAPGRSGSVSLIEGFDRAKIFAIKLEDLDAQAWLSTRFVYKHIVKQGRRAQIITPIRDPLSLLIAYFFSMISKNPDLLDHAKKNDIKSLTDEFIRQCLHDWPFNHFLDWFQDEFHSHLGINIFEYSFNTEKKYLFVPHLKYPTLILRNDLSDTKKEELIRTYTNHKINIIRTNTADKKQFAALYKEFTDTMKLPKEELNRIYDTKYAQHFFNKEEIQSKFSKYVN